MNNADGRLISPRAIVRDGMSDGMTRRERLAIADRDRRALAALDSFDTETRWKIIALCDAFKAKHGGPR